MVDIQQWLAATDDRAPPSESPDHCMLDSLWADSHQQGKGQEKRGRSDRRRKRARASSDSSIIAARGPPPADRNRARPVPHSLPSERSRSASSTETGHSAFNRDSRPVTGDAVPQKTYDRRPRHKTRADRYQPKQKGRKADQDARKQKKSKTRRKSYRSRDGGRTAGLVQSFQLRNGPKNSRLTLNPGTTTGLFKHGRASAQVTGRGAGLPDLAFNEMRFLQRPTEHQDVPVEPSERPRGRKKKNSKPVDDAEISAYFDATNPANPTNDPDPPPERGSHEQSGRQARDRCAGRPTPSPVELPTRPFLGFGSKGAGPPSKETLIDHDSYLSWSETPVRDVRDGHRARVEEDLDTLAVKRPQVGNEDARGLQQERNREHDAHEAPSRFERLRSRRGRELAAVEELQPPTRHARSGEAHRSTVRATSQSLPWVPPGQLLNELHEAAGSMRDDYHTSDILNIHNHELMPTDNDAGHPSVDQPDADLKDQRSMSTLSIDRLLDNVRNHLEPVDAGYATTEQDSRRVRNWEREQDPTEMLSPSVRRRRDTTKQPHRSGSHAQYKIDESEEVHPHRAIHQLQNPESIAMAHHNSAATRERLPGANGREFLLRRTLAQQNGTRDGAAASFEQLLHHQPWLVQASAKQAEDLAVGPRSQFKPGIYETQCDQLQSEGTSLLQQRELTPACSLLGTSMSIGRTLASEQDAYSMVEGPNGDGMSGFCWKPNKLY